MKVKWWERLLTELAACVMSHAEFDAFLAKYGLAIDAQYRVVRATVNDGGSAGAPRE